jgi:hypothetical protein
MRKLLLFASSVVLILTGCATVGISRGSAPPVNLVIVTESPLRQGDADLLLKITEDYIRQYVHDGQPLTLSLMLGEAHTMLWGGGGFDASSRGGYYGPENFNPAYSGHTVPLVGGFNAVDIGYQPRVGVGGGGYGYSSGYSSTLRLGMMTARYRITDASGKVLESKTFTLYPEAYMQGMPDARLSVFHDAASYVAKRVAQTH